VDFRVPAGFDNNPAGARRAAMLEELIGADAAATLIRHAGASVLKIPTLRWAFTRARDAAIRAEYDAGATLEELAIQYRLSTRRLLCIMKGGTAAGERLAVSASRRKRAVPVEQGELF
jgi:hypothetical protein